jgi:hypothetical protein
MQRSAGWVEVLSVDGQRIGRGHLSLRERIGSDGQPEWEGTLDWLRIDRSVRAVGPGLYRLRFEQAADEQRVHVDRLGRVGSSVRFAELRCVDDCELPLTLSYAGGA